jgi:putative Mn2+ efflux pump MntP
MITTEEKAARATRMIFAGIFLFCIGMILAIIGIVGASSSSSSINGWDYYLAGFVLIGLGMLLMTVGKRRLGTARKELWQENWK